MNLLRIIDKIISSSENSNKILINELYCTRLRSPMSSCYVCINKCPEQAIEINDSAIKLSDKCSLCKLCINICPNFVFDLKEVSDISDKAMIYGDKAYYFCSKGKSESNIDNNDGNNCNSVNGNESSNSSSAELNKSLISNNFDNQDNNENSSDSRNRLFSEKKTNSVADTRFNFNVVSCINEVDNTDIIKHLKNAKEINFITSDCEDCRYNFFYKKKMKAINRILTCLADADGNNINILEKIKFIDYNKFDFSYIINNDKKENKKIKGKLLSKNKCDRGDRAAAERTVNLNLNFSTGGEHTSNPDINDGNNAAAISTNTPAGSGINNLNDEYSKRRLFFREISKTIKENALKLAKNFPLEELPFNEFFLSNDDKKLNKLFFKKRFKLFNFIKCNPECLDLLDIRLPSINRNCLLCANCWEFCPTGALTYNNETDTVMLDPYLCTGCKLCKDLCSFGAVKMVRPAGLRDVSSQKVLFKKITFD
jgi:Fe-S-cluster-containing hydrogenase component 2